ncbi:MAG TPA: hypothetical protein QF361_01860 [Gammaproteobacteria bacterium]|nr:hypothetical protein [Gammaproteobacteria bacterium]
MNRRLWIVLLVMASFMPWRIALACAHQTGLMQQRCCCVEQHMACPRIKTGVGACCKAVAAAPSQIADSQNDTLPSADGGKPLSPPPSHPKFDPLVFSSGRSPPRTAPDRSWLAGSETYLQTARLRL